jgi:endo-1,4-beta-xylanase
MRQRIGMVLRILALSVLALFILVMAAGAQDRSPPGFEATAPTKPFPDGSFEQGPATWEFWQNAEGLGAFEVTEHRPHAGKKCGKLTVKNTSSEIWHVQLVQRGFSVEKNRIYRLQYWARGESDAGVLEVAFVKGSPPWTFYSASKQKVTSEWKRYEMSFTAPATTNDIQVAFQCASQRGDYFVDDIAFTAEGRMDLKPVPADWYARSEQRIDSLRKGDFTLAAKTKDGRPCEGSAEVRLKRHAFPWGTCLNFQGGTFENKYKETALRYFNSGVFENAFKWEEFERVEGKPDIDDLERYLKWGEQHDFPIRGHALVWGIEKYGFDKHWARLKSDDFLRQSIRKRIQRDLSRYRGRIKEYDVWNEPLHEPALFNRLGWEIMDSAFHWAHAADPKAKLYINEYSIISGGDAKPYRDIVEGALKRGVPIHGIGVQGHFSGPVDPLDVAAKLSYMAETGLPLKVTEFDLDVQGLGLSEPRMAGEYAKILRTAFSHPAIEGFLFWGFWDARHWRPGAGLFDGDFKPKAAADSVYRLIHEVWTTSGALRLDSLGQAGFRGFYGVYDVRLRCSDGTGRNLSAKFLKNGPRKVEAVAE